MEKITLTITGMHCDSCAKIIKATLEEKDGVALVSVDYNSKKAILEFDPSKISLDEIKKEIEELGYKTI